MLRISQFLQDTFNTWDTHLGTCMVELIKPSCQAEKGAHKLFIHLNNIYIECTSKLKRKLHTIIRVLLEDRAVVLWLCIKLQFCLFWPHQEHFHYLCESKIRSFYLYAIAKNEMQICSNKHETGLVLWYFEGRKIKFST